jgi:hypothetical protein
MPSSGSSNSKAISGTQPAALPCRPIRVVFFDSIRWVSDRVVKRLSHFISDPTILDADDGSPHADWIFERT